MKTLMIIFATISILSAEQTIVKDDLKKLMWEDTIHTEDTKVNYTQAISYCKELKLGEFTDWRVPTLQELFSIVDYKRYKPAILKEFRHYNKDTLYWSSTPYVKESDEYWGINFKDGASSNAAINYDRYIRCVREDK